MTSDLKQFFNIYSKRVDQNLRNSLPTRVPGGERLLEAMAYSLLRGGKRFRPVLVYAGSLATGGRPESVITDAAACAIECLHAYSLIHDDLPAMDDDDLRRGEPTCHRAFDEATAILAGDALQCLAFEILSKAKASPQVVVSMIQELSRAAGATGMVVGQAIDLAAANQTLTLEQLERMHNHKTGALIEASVLMGAIASGLAQPAQLKALRLYAKAVGLCFQVQDDILDVVADTDTLGKRQGADQERNKPTYVSLLGLDQARAKARALHEQALHALMPFDAKADPLRQLSAYVIDRTH